MNYLNLKKIKKNTNSESLYVDDTGTIYLRGTYEGDFDKNDIENIAELKQKGNLIQPTNLLNLVSGNIFGNGENSNLKLRDSDDQREFVYDETANTKFINSLLEDTSSRFHADDFGTIETHYDYATNTCELNNGKQRTVRTYTFLLTLIEATKLAFPNDYEEICDFILDLICIKPTSSNNDRNPRYIPFDKYLEFKNDYIELFNAVVNGANINELINNSLKDSLFDLYLEKLLSFASKFNNGFEFTNNILRNLSKAELILKTVSKEKKEIQFTTGNSTQVSLDYRNKIDGNYKLLFEKCNRFSEFSKGVDEISKLSFIKRSDKYNEEDYHKNTVAILAQQTCLRVYNYVDRPTLNGKNNSKRISLSSANCYEYMASYCSKNDENEKEFCKNTLEVIDDIKFLYNYFPNEANKLLNWDESVLLKESTTSTFTINWLPFILFIVNIYRKKIMKGNNNYEFDNKRWNKDDILKLLQDFFRFVELQLLCCRGTKFFQMFSGIMSTKFYPIANQISSSSELVIKCGENFQFAYESYFFNDIKAINFLANPMNDIFSKKQPLRILTDLTKEIYSEKNFTLSSPSWDHDWAQAILEKMMKRFPTYYGFKKGCLGNLNLINKPDNSKFSDKILPYEKHTAEEYRANAVYCYQSELFKEVYSDEILEKIEKIDEKIENNTYDITIFKEMENVLRELSLNKANIYVKLMHMDCIDKYNATLSYTSETKEQQSCGDDEDEDCCEE